jgi:D-alanyl-lipoteichoic acid acyltransferase DltB (MBOAT superfamily)
MKGIVTVEYLRMGGTPLSVSRWLAFAAGWPGMQPALFAQPRASQAGALSLFVRGVVRAALGAALFVLACVVTRTTRSPLLASILLLPSLSLMLHFGLFNMVAAMWRALGIPAAPLFDAPLRSTSLTEFWGRRWNLAFSEMCQLAVYKPLAPWLGRGPATAAAFAFSALLHELAISVPVKTGFGLPLLYFALHGALTVFEKRMRKNGSGWPASALWGRVWSVFWLVTPMPILFHPAFLRQVLWPLVGIE